MCDWVIGWLRYEASVAHQQCLALIKPVLADVAKLESIMGP